nr:unnamed protein product [Spirometra erinaceieuropaei]
MGSPISGFIAEAVLQRLESLVFQHHRPKFWARYVDDTFVVIEWDRVLTFQEHLNAVFPDIQFTMEEEENNQLAFLDVLVCRKDCGGLIEKITAYYCETPEEPCTLYDVYGRPGYGRNFERHVLCVQACQFVAKVEQSTETSFKLCRGVEERCSPIEKKDGTFDGFRKCIFKCDGWMNLENTKENTAYLCPLRGDCQQGNYFTKRNKAGAFASLKTCFETCMSE